MPDPLAGRAAASPNKAAVIDASTGAVTTWAELDEAAGAMAGKLREAGVRGGDRVAVVAAPGLEVIATLHAGMRLGAALMPMSPRVPARELSRALADAGPVLLVTPANFDAAFVDRSRTQVTTFTALGAIPADPVPGGDLDEVADVCVVYTSGSSGPPKGVRLTMRNCIASATGCAEALGMNGPDDRWLLTLGTHRVGGIAILFRSLLTGAAVVVVPRFAEATVVAAMRHRPTLMSLVPAMLVRLVAHGAQRDLCALRAILLGGAPAPAASVRRWAGYGLPVCASYGLTETASQIAVVPPGEANRFAGSAGLVHSQARVSILSEDAAGQPDRGAPVGEIVVSGPVLSPGYVGLPEAPRGSDGTATNRTFRTGDVGYLDERRALIIVGRRDYTIITGGEKVNPEEVEAVLGMHPGVLDAAVRGIPDETYGSVVEAVIVGDADEVALRRWCADQLASYKVPRRYRVVGALPRSDDGKLLRELLADS